MQDHLGKFNRLSCRDPVRSHQFSKSVPEHLIAQLAEELEATAWKHNLSGKIQMISKDEIKKRLGRSPDLADALMMFYEAQEGAFDFSALGGPTRESVGL